MMRCNVEKVHIDTNTFSYMCKCWKLKRIDWESTKKQFPFERLSNLFFFSFFTTIRKLYEYTLVCCSYHKEIEKYESLWTMSDAKMQFLICKCMQKGNFFRLLQFIFIFVHFISMIIFPLRFHSSGAQRKVTLSSFYFTNLMDNPLQFVFFSLSSHVWNVIIHHSNINIINLH